MEQQTSSNIETVDSPALFQAIQKILEQQPTGVKISELSRILLIEENELSVILSIYNSSWCTFFEFGRILEYPIKGTYIYLLPGHPAIREQTPKITMPPITRIVSRDNLSLQDEILLLRQKLQEKIQENLQEKIQAKLH